MRVAIVHYWLVGMRGGEKVLEEICQLFPEADIFTHAVEPQRLSPIILRHKITETFIAKLPGGKKFFRKYLPLMPFALESLDLTAYDLVISSESGPAKGCITSPEAFHVCYVHSPMRYLWDQYWIYKKDAGLLEKFALQLLASPLRLWDFASAARLDRIIANSHFVRRRIKKSWGRDSTVVYPPVDVESFTATPKTGSDATTPYLFVGEFVSYKKPDLALKACQKLGRPLLMIGDGPLTSQLRREAATTTKIMSRVSFEQLKEEFASCRALLYPGVEDFGITPLEVSASGSPVIALGRGGAAETVVHNETGILFKEQSVEGLAAAILEFEAQESGFSPQRAREQAANFDARRFQQAFLHALISQAPEHLKDPLLERQKNTEANDR